MVSKTEAHYEMFNDNIMHDDYLAFANKLFNIYPIDNLRLKFETLTRYVRMKEILKLMQKNIFMIEYL